MLTIHDETLNVWTHLIGFFIFLFLTVYTVTNNPQVMDIGSWQQLLKRLQLQKFQEQLIKCLPSLPDVTTLYKFQEEFRTSFPYLPDILTKCLPGQIVHRSQSSNIDEQNTNDGLIDMIVPLVCRSITRWPFLRCNVLSPRQQHLSPLCCHSKRLPNIMLRLDYAGIAALMSTSFYLPVYYSFMCNPFFCELYLSAITLLGIATIVFFLLLVFDQPKFSTVRASLVFGMGVSGIAPILLQLILYRHHPEALQTTGFEILMGLLYGFGALIYASRITERWRPGRFDIAGYSHQLFHVLLVAAAYTYYQAGLIYLRWPDLRGLLECGIMY